MNEEDRVVGFPSPEVLMDAWVTGQQYARRSPLSAVQGWARKLRGTEPYSYQWWRLQGALAYVGARQVFPPEASRQWSKATRPGAGPANDR